MHCPTEDAVLAFVGGTVTRNAVTNPGQDLVVDVGKTDVAVVADMYCAASTKWPPATASH